MGESEESNRGPKDYSCPNCGSNKTRKSSVVWEEGLSEIHTETKGGLIGSGGVGVAAGRTSGFSQTGASSSNAPPRYEVPIRWVLLLIVATVFGLIIFPSIFDNAVIGFMVALIGVPISVIALQSYLEPQDRSEIERWNKQWYCLRCGSNFIADK
ncbi:hypothetical protein SAMN06297468_2518 [Altererythrobacter xiamenensis]|uniref:Uncharacterized protein n=1 Tax=Altererythrobacter xiamenensis TaxID=1316679 RepID=A0A1Y6FHW7_9SPHN|nr:hypothetical protein [Altererythrobacter xiamenensis]SMQ74287.1 hypothetical protein SAMN06297468_2518 [Altererythrobacter xiamenensis]